MRWFRPVQPRKVTDELTRTADVAAEILLHRVNLVSDGGAEVDNLSVELFARGDDDDVVAPDVAVEDAAVVEPFDSVKHIIEDCEESAVLRRSMLSPTSAMPSSYRSREW